MDLMYALEQTSVQTAIMAQLLKFHHTSFVHEHVCNAAQAGEVTSKVPCGQCRARQWPLDKQQSKL